jgi:transposase InsO family protein
MQHGNAPLTPLGRRRLVALVEEEHLTFEAAAAASNVSRSTAHTWVTHWRAADEKSRASLSCLEDRSSAPRRQPSLTGKEVHDRICERRRRTGWGPQLIAYELGIPCQGRLKTHPLREGIAHRTIPLRMPKRNGKVERYQQTLKREWGLGQRYRSSEHRAKALPHWLHHYNHTRRHSSIGNRPPVSRVRDVLRQDS